MVFNDNVMAPCRSPIFYFYFFAKCGSNLVSSDGMNVMLF